MPETKPVQPLTAEKIDDSTYRIEDNGVRVFLIIGTERALLVDTGFGTAGSLKAVVETLTDKPVFLVNTHADGDHIGCNAEFDMAGMHPAEMPYYFQNAKPGAGVRAIWDGEIIDLGGRSLEAILIPGHTPGSLALLDRERRVLISGDSLSAGPVFMFGEIRSLHAYIASMEKLIAMSGEFDTVYPSHGMFPISSAQMEKALAAAKKLLAGELSPADPPFPIPAKMFAYGDAAFFY